MSRYIESGYGKKTEAGQWISQAEAAKLRGVSRQAIAQLVKRGRFETLLIGGMRNSNLSLPALPRRASAKVAGS